MNIGPIILYDYLSVCTYNGTEIIIYYGFETLISSVIKLWQEDKENYCIGLGKRNSLNLFSNKPTFNINNTSTDSCVMYQES